MRFTGLPNAKPLGKSDRFAGLTLLPSGIDLSDHLSRPTRYRGAHATYPELKEDEQPPVRIRTSLLLGLAPDGGYLAVDITANAGGLLHHLFTLTRSNELQCKETLPYTPSIKRSFSVALSADHPARALPGTVLCGARTFLGPS
jgi:hypothetical protein